MFVHVVLSEFKGEDCNTGVNADNYCHLTLSLSTMLANVRYPGYAQTNHDGYHWRQAVSPNSECDISSRRGYIGQLSDLESLLGNMTFEDFLGIPGE